MAGDEADSKRVEDINIHGHTADEARQIAIANLRALECSLSVQDVASSNPRLANLNALLNQRVLSGSANTADLFAAIRRETAFVTKAAEDVNLLPNQLHPDACPTDNECQKKRNQAYSMDPSASV